jgi:lipase chaperone LimK
MNNKDTQLIRKITTEYVDFIKRTNALIDETKRATVLALKETLKLQDGDSILIKEDGSIEVIPAETGKEENMPKENEKSDKVTLNGREVTAEELERQREAIKNQKGARLEEVSQGNFRLHLKD